MSPAPDAEGLLVEAARALEQMDPLAATRAIGRALERLISGPAPADLEPLLFAHARLLAYAGGEAARLESELERLGLDLRGSAAGPYPRSSVRSRATA